MNSLDEILDIANLKVEVKKRNVKSLRIGVFPPTGRVRVTAPLSYENHLIESVVIKKLNWIKRQQGQLLSQERQTEREAVSGESYFFKGKKYKLAVIHGGARGRLILKNSSKMELSISNSASKDTRLNVINSFYRKSLQEELDVLLPKVEERLGVKVKNCSIRKMKNRWGSCDPKNKRITINIELIKKNPACLNYILIHELVHILEDNHGEEFIKLMDQFLPNWRYARDLLNTAPLAHANWDY